jgi:hypothetical protein
MSAPFVKITSDYGWIGRFAWHNSIDCRINITDWRSCGFRIWGMVAWLQNWGPRGGIKP